MTGAKNFVPPDLEVVKTHYYDASINLYEVARRCGVSQPTVSKCIRDNNLPSRKDLGISAPIKRKKKLVGAKKNRTRFIKDCPGCKFLKACKALPVSEPVKCETRWSSDDVEIETDVNYIRSVGIGEMVRVA